MTGEQRPAVSVVVITLNEEKNIVSCLDALAAQSCPADQYEVIVVDAGSDRTAEIAAGYKNVRVIHSEKGFARQKNAGWRAARFDVIAFTDADCIVPADWVEHIARLFSERSVQAAAGDAFMPTGTGWLGRCIGAVGHPGGGSLGLQANMKSDTSELDFMAGCNSVITRDLLVQLHGYSSEFEQGGEDLDLSRRIREAGHPIHYDPEIFLYHKPHEPLGHFCRWNMGVGVTRWSLHRPSLVGIIFYPWFPVWPGLLLIFWMLLTLIIPPLGIFVAVVAWLKWLAVLRLFSRPYQVLWQRREQTGVSRWAALTMVPFLVMMRQICMSIGEWIKWKRERVDRKGGTGGPAG